MSNFSLLAILRKSSPAQGELKKLVEICLKISVQYLHFTHKKLHRLLYSDEMKLEDIAIDAISSLFIPDQQSGIIVILHSAKKWESKIKTEDDALYFVNKVVSKRTEQHISFLLKESDPIFSRILDTIKYRIKKQGYQKIHHLGTGYIVEAEYDNKSKNWISIDEFKNLPSSVFINHKTLFKDLFTYLKEETIYFPAIPLNALVMKLKELRLSLFIHKEIEDTFEESMDIRSILNSAYTETLLKLDNTYKVKGKLSDDEIEAMKLALRDILNDLKDGGINPGLFNYLTIHKPNLTQDEYYSNYHNILEYLVKVMRNKIAEKLSKVESKISE